MTTVYEKFENKLYDELECQATQNAKEAYDILYEDNPNKETASYRNKEIMNFKERFFNIAICKHMQKMQIQINKLKSI